VSPLSDFSLPGVAPDVINDLATKTVEVARGLFENKLVTSTFGVVSNVIPNTQYVLITPSGFSKLTLNTNHLIIVNLDAKLVQGNFRPSVETPMHTYIHRHRPELSTVIHTHSPLACAFAAANREIPCVSAEQAFYFGGRVPLIRKYSLPGSKEPAELAAVLKGLEQCDAVLLRKHGVVVVGRTPDEALESAIVLEDVANMAVHSMTIAKPKEFTQKELASLRVFKRTKYGQHPSPK